MWKMWPHLCQNKGGSGGWSKVWEVKWILLLSSSLFSKLQNNTMAEPPQTLPLYSIYAKAGVVVGLCDWDFIGQRASVASCVNLGCALADCEIQHPHPPSLTRNLSPEIHTIYIYRACPVGGFGSYTNMFTDAQEQKATCGAAPAAQVLQCNSQG